MLVCLSGGESTGKTTLSKWLAEYFSSTWIPEYAREYLEGRDLDSHPFVARDFTEIAKQQAHLVKCQLLSHNDPQKPIFCDTDAVITLMWAEILIGSCPEEVVKLSKEQPYDLYLINDPEVPYEEDDLRFLPNIEQRRTFHEKLLQEMEKRNYKYKILSGSLQQRKDESIQTILDFQKGDF